ncbi:hypothetical protein Mal64_37420 [Pseudobythopirellula maris]|uniref:DUF374 domain-containing protein n=1 Tax=Pseudobythopirellula maris TaxID=2527991 RepID=A0A5C5ZHR8_9BACT|nr:lysophospholipid acyltransferase family protein [Pseudobythopirellula maris]TWT86912.1 hypothetical protein Mal64_37420 [Pseudobythopirellula maris]
MKINSPTANEALGVGVQWSIYALMSTLRYRVAYAEPCVDPVHGPAGPYLFVFWHENILLPLYLRPNCGVTMLLSRHRDADVLEVIARRSGFGFVRGSTGRGGVAALKTLAAEGRHRHLAITPDGPRGPRRQLAPGPIYLASKLGVPIVALGFGCKQPWRLSSWDRFVIPRPFSTARVVMSEPLHVPAGLNRAGLERRRVQVERVLVDVNEQAEAWAEGRVSRSDGLACRRQAAPNVHESLQTCRPAA